MRQTTLLLNASYEPLKILSWESAIGMWLSGKVEIVAEYSHRVYDEAKAAFLDGWSGLMPAVVRLVKYITAHKTKVKFSRRNVFGRDSFQCQYCFSSPGTHELTYDHVLPRSRGGRTCWENIVTSCLPCNAEKADRTPQEAGMVLKTQPVKPGVRPLLGKLFANIPNTPDEWRDYLYWENELETE